MRWRLGIACGLVLGMAAFLDAAPGEPVHSRAPAASPACAPFPFVDEGPRRPDFVAFRNWLLDAVARRDVDAVVGIAVPDIALSFGAIDASGRDVLRAQLADKDHHRWDGLRDLLLLGGTFGSPDDFTAPYVYAKWDYSRDAFEEQAIVASGVRLRAAPRADAPVIGSLSYCIVSVPSSKQPHDEAWNTWRAVTLDGDHLAFVASRYLRRANDLRAGFQFKDGRWHMTFFIGGD